MQVQSSTKAWYRYPIMWLVVAPPIGSVIAGIITMVLILEHPDPDVRTPYATVAVAHGSAANSVVPPAE